MNFSGVNSKFRNIAIFLLANLQTVFSITVIYLRKELLTRSCNVSLFVTIRQKTKQILAWTILLIYILPTYILIKWCILFQDRS